MTWLRPFSDEENGALQHLVPSEGWLVNAACGRMVNLQFATKEPQRKKCHYCLVAVARAERRAA